MVDGSSNTLLAARQTPVDRFRQPRGSVGLVLVCALACGCARGPAKATFPAEDANPPEGSGTSAPGAADPDLPPGTSEQGPATPEMTPSSPGTLEQDMLVPSAGSQSMGEPDLPVSDPTPEQVSMMGGAPDHGDPSPGGQEMPPDNPETPPENPDMPPGDPAEMPSENPDTPPDNPDMPDPEPQPDPVPDWAPRALDPAPDGRTLPLLNHEPRFEAQQHGSFTDEYLFGPGEIIKVGVRRDWGSSIVFFGQSVAGADPMNQTNTIDAHDTGREVQIALYDPDRVQQGCAHDASCRSAGQSCPPSIRYLGWNPVQGGNRCNLGSGTDSIEQRDGALVATVRPLHWNPDWAAPNCDADSCSGPGRDTRSNILYRQTLRFVTDHIVEMDMYIENRSDMSHETQDHELPTLYASYGREGTPNLNRLFNSEGVEISIDEPANDGFFVRNFDSPGGWAAFQEANLTYGVGLFYENGNGGFQGWQKAGVFNNFRAPMDFPIPARAIIGARAYLLIGDFETISAQAQWLEQNLAPFGHLDSAVLDENLQVSGWVLDNRPMDSVEVLVDGFPVGTVPIDRERADVCIRWPQYRACPTVGFGGAVDWPLGATGERVVDIRATDTHGHAKIIARQTLDSGL